MNVGIVEVLDLLKSIVQRLYVLRQALWGNVRHESLI